MQDSIFTKIINGEIPCHKIYEDDKTLAFLDIDPLLPGHTLVIPKTQVDHIEDLADEDYHALFQTVKAVSKQLQAVLGTKRAVIQVLGFDVPHAHVHVVPANSGNEFTGAIGDHRNRSSVPEPDHAELAKMAEKLAF